MTQSACQANAQRNHQDAPLTRRRFGQFAAALAGTLAAARLTNGQEAKPATDRKIKLGLDNFAVRAMGWKAPALIDYAASLATDSLFISDLDAFESFEKPYLIDLKKKAADQGLQIHVGTWSICPTSTTFRKTWGTAEEHLRLGISVAQAVGSPVLRVILGNGGDRATHGGIEARIADTVKVCKACRSVAVDAGVKIAVENHAGDMQAHELAGLIEEAGKDYVGANLDSGNAVWTLEDPLASLEVLGPYAVTTSLRDSAIWESEKGITVQWTAMGDGAIDWKAYFERFVQLCPETPVHIETISGFNREFPIWTADFWKPWPQARAADLARLMAIAKRGAPRPAWMPPAGQDRKVAEQEYQKEQIERSIRFCKQTLGLGLKR
ncbi:MAG: sugar phosphate isomerase/epimerase [Pirellulales bacterium]